MHQPTTLGEKLAPETTRPKSGAWLHNALFLLTSTGLLAAIFILPVYWYLAHPDFGRTTMLAAVAALFVLWLFIVVRRHASTSRRKPHSLLAHDRQGFMRDLELDAKTAILDGSNIYHFGHSNGLDAQPLGEIAHRLRGEGYRIVCFFDANIFYTLNEHGAFAKDQAHSIALLEDIFGLAHTEIYVVPSGVQADKYVLDSLKHLPISFAVTNDRYRDYAKAYPGVMKDRQWRKGVVISNSRIRLQ